MVLLRVMLVAALSGFLACGGDPSGRIDDLYALQRDPTPENLSRVREFLQDPDRDVRATAVFILSTAEVSDGLEIALSGLDDPDGFVRATAAKCLEDLGDPLAVPRLVDRLANDGDWHVRQRAAEALSRLGGEEAAAGLAGALEDPVKQVRLAAVRGVARTFPAEFVPLLSHIVTGDSEWEIRVQAAGALGRSGVSEAREPLARAASDANEFVRSAASRALRELEEAGTPEPLPGD